MGDGMATKKVTINLEDEHVAAIRKLVASHKAESVSGFIQHAVDVSLADVAGWGAVLGLALDSAGGPLTRRERASADGVLKRRLKSRRKKAAWAGSRSTRAR
jgi:hypothetical protein